jgi:hypothetical protein
LSPARNRKPVVHGRDHAPGGSDPIPGGVGAHIIEDEGVILPAQPHLNFTGPGVTVTDNPASATTEVDITSGGAANVYHPRFVVAVAQNVAIPNGASEWQVPFPLTEIVTNDVYGIPGYGTPQGYWIPSGNTTWSGDHFANSASTGNPFQILPDTTTGRTRGLYLISVGLVCGPNTPQKVTVFVLLPKSGGHSGSGVPPFTSSNGYYEPVSLDYPVPQQWTRTFWVHITNLNVVFPPDDIGVYLTYSGTEALTAGVAISCTMLNLPYASLMP